MGILPSWQDIKGSAQGWKNILSGQTWQGTAPIHTGNWGTPDLGFTEIWRPFTAPPAQANDVNWRPESNYPKGTYNEPAPTDGGGGGGISPEEQAVIDQQNRLRGEISSGYDQYISQLDQILNTGLPAQRTAQEGIVGSQYQSGISQLGSQKEQGLYDLGVESRKVGTRQAKTLKDLSADIRNMFRAGNVMLGSMGASDSSAANQYSYALAKMGSKRRSDVMGQSNEAYQQIADRKFKLQNLFNQETQRLGSERDQKILSISSWFADSQNQIKQYKAQGMLNKNIDLANLSKSLLEQATNALMNTQIEYKNRRSALESWALSNAENINQLKTNWQGIAAFQAPQQTYRPMSGTPTVDSSGNLRFRPSYGYGSSNEEKTSFQNPSWLTG